MSSVEFVLIKRVMNERLREKNAKSAKDKVEMENCSDWRVFRISSWMAACVSVCGTYLWFTISKWRVSFIFPHPTSSSYSADTSFLEDCTHVHREEAAKPAIYICMVAALGITQHLLCECHVCRRVDCRVVVLMELNSGFGSKNTIHMCNWVRMDGWMHRWMRVRVCYVLRWN